MKKVLMSIVVLAFLGCVDEDQIRKEGYESGHKAGLSIGYENGFAEGLEEGKASKYSDLMAKYYGSSNMLRLNSTAFDPNIDSRSIVRRLNDDQGSFASVIHEINIDVLRGLSSGMGLSGGQQSQLVTIYEKSHSQIAGQYFQQYKDLCERKELNRNPEALIKYVHYDRAEALASVLSNQICATIGMIIGLFEIETGAGIIVGVLAGEPCRVVLEQVLKPITDDLLESGFIEDVETSKVTIERRTSRMIVELATIEKQYSTTVEVTREQKIFWGMAKSTATASASYYGIIKAGYDFGNPFAIEIDHLAHKIYLKLSSAKIFDPIVYPRMEKIENGWWAQIDENTINSMYVSATNQVVNMAIQDDIIRQAEENAGLFLTLLFEPVAQIPPIPFTVEISNGRVRYE